MNQREVIISNYVDAYNDFDTDGMTRDMTDSIRFENISNGKTDMIIEGLTNFREQAEQMKKFFLKRKQTIKSFKHSENETEIEISYHAVIAADLPNGLKKDSEINLEGKSVFKFSHDKITELKDIISTSD